MASNVKPLTIEELSELNDLEMASRGVTRDDVTRSLRSRLRMLKSGRSGARKGEVTKPVSLESRVTALEKEVKRLRGLIERKNG